MAAAVGSAFHDAEVNRDVVVARGLADGIEIAVFDADSLTHVMCEQRLLQVGFELRSFRSLDPERVAWHEGFAKRDESRSPVRPRRQSTQRLFLSLLLVAATRGLFGRGRP